MLTSVPAEIGQLTSLRVGPRRNRLTSVPAEIGQLTSLKGWASKAIKLTSVPAEIGAAHGAAKLNWIAP